MAGIFHALNPHLGVVQPSPRVQKLHARSHHFMIEPESLGRADTGLQSSLTLPQRVLINM